MPYICIDCGKNTRDRFVGFGAHSCYSPIPSLCDACFHQRFAGGLDEANAEAQDYLALIRRDSNLYDEYRRKIYAIVDVAINEFLEQYDPINCDKNLLKMIRFKHGGSAQFVHNRKTAFSKKVLPLIDYSKVETLEEEHLGKHNIIVKDIEKYLLGKKNKNIPWYCRREYKYKVNGETLVFYVISDIRWHNEGRYSAHWYVLGTTQIIYDYISHNREFFESITKKLNDAIKATGGYPQSPQNQDVCHYRKGKQQCTIHKT